MAFDWSDYISFAETLTAGHPTQAQLRSATSRAYYGAFIKCRNKSPYANVKGGDVHFKVMNHYKREGATRLEFTISNNLDALRIKRNEADYDSHYTANVQTTENHIKLAKTITDNLSKIDVD